MDIKHLDDTYVAHTYGRFPLQIDHGKGSFLYDEKGKEYIDLGTGIAVNIFGAADDEWLAAVTKQAAILPHTSNLYYSAPCARLAEMLCSKTGMKKVFFSNSGAEANECAIKTARLWSLQNKGPSHHTIITLKNSFHGRTITTLAATGQEEFHTDFGPFTEGFVHADAHDAADIRRLIKENNCAAIMLELVQGEGGVIALCQDYVDTVKALAEENNLLIIADEVQTGNGRTGTLYAYMQYGLQPDIVTTAKGLGGGLPIGACIFGERTADILTPGSHGSTFGGNPIAAAGALSILSRLDDAMMVEVRSKAAYIREILNGAPGVKSVSGLGMMIGVECTRPTADVIADCMEAGLLVISAHGRIRLLPPLNIRMKDLTKAMNILSAVLAK